jgi:hypothetical protein
MHACQSSLINPSWKNTLAVLSPSLKEDSCEIDLQLQKNRIHIIALVTIINFSLMVTCIFLLPHLYVLKVLTSTATLLSGLLFPLQIWITDNESNIKAIKEYTTKERPSKAATDRIRTNLRAAHFFTQNKINPNKKNEFGETLLSTLPRIDIFKLLVSGGFKVLEKDKNHSSCFERAISSENPEYLDYILSNHLASPRDFTYQEQIDFWLKIGSSKTALLLHKYGFNPNIKNSKNETPLLLLIKNSLDEFAELNRQCWTKLSLGTHVEALLSAMASPYIEIFYHGSFKDAFDIRAPNDVTSALNRWRRRQQRA